MLGMIWTLNAKAGTGTGCRAGTDVLHSWTHDHSVQLRFKTSVSGLAQ